MIFKNNINIHQVWVINFCWVIDTSYKFSYGLKRENQHILVFFTSIELAWTPTNLFRAGTMVTPHSTPHALTPNLRLTQQTCRCFRPANLPRGTWGSRLCGVRSWLWDLELEGKGRDTGRKIYIGSACQSSEPYVLFGVSMYGALRLMLGWLSCPPRYPDLLYVVQGANA
jgi:hypothetical protein